MAILPRAELEQMTVIKLRELALAQYPNLQGVSGMKKEALVEAIIAEETSQGLRPKEEKAQVRAAAEMATLKGRIRGLKADRGKALDAKDRKGLKAVRAQIKRVKRKMRGLKTAS